MITCDYLIIGSGFAGIGLKYKLIGKTIIIDKKPFSYKIGESQVPILLNADPGLFSLIPKVVKMKSYTRKLGTIFCDSYHGRHASYFPTSLGTSFAWHCEREEIEKLLAKELSVDIKQEMIVEIDLSKNTVVTDKNTYRFKKYLLDCSGPAMVLANKLKLVDPVGQFQGMKAQWSYWAIDEINKDVDSWGNWTVINKVASDSWIWQIPLYDSSILSMGLLHRGEPLSQDQLFEYLEKRSAACYKLTSIARNPKRAIKPYMKEVYSRLHYSKKSRQCAGKNWILVGDAFCFADPVYSVGSGVAMLEAITIANNLNKNNGQFDHKWYEEKCNALIKTVIDGIGTWYSGAAFNKDVNKEVNKTMLQCGFSRHFEPSSITEKAKNLQQENIEPFMPSVHQPFAGVFLRHGIKVYFFDKNLFDKAKGTLCVLLDAKPTRISNRAVSEFLEKYVIGKKLSFPDLYLMVDLNLRDLNDRDTFWKVIRLIEFNEGKNICKGDRLFYFHPEKYETVSGKLRLGEQSRELIVEDTATIDFFETLRGKILSGKELMKLASRVSSVVYDNTFAFIKIFTIGHIFGQSLYFKGSKTAHATTAKNRLVPIMKD